MKEKIHYKPVLTALQNIIEQTKKKADNKAICLELEEKIQELVEAKEEDNEMTDRHLMPPPPTVPSNKRNIRQRRHKSDEDEDDSSDDSEEDIDNVPVVKCEFEIDLVNISILCIYNYINNIISYNYAQ